MPSHLAHPPQKTIQPHTSLLSRIAISDRMGYSNIAQRGYEIGTSNRLSLVAKERQGRNIVLHTTKRWHA